MSKLIKLAGLWKNTSKTGNNYLAGKLEGIGKVLIMANKYKKAGEKGPDYYIYKSSDDEPSSASAVGQDFIASDLSDNDDVPF